MIVSNSLKIKPPQEALRYAPIEAIEIKTNLILEKALESQKISLPNTLKDFKILSGISKALTLFLQEFAKRFEKEKPSLFSLYTLTFREFDPKQGRVVEYRFLSVDKTG